MTRYKIRQTILNGRHEHVRMPEDYDASLVTSDDVAHDEQLRIIDKNGGICADCGGVVEDPLEGWGDFQFCDACLDAQREADERASEHIQKDPFLRTLRDIIHRCEFPRD